jgi:deoxyhypusine synthase
MTAPEAATAAVFVDSEVPDTPICRGFDFTADIPTDYDSLFRSYATSGFQASNLSRSIELINEMLHFQFQPGEIEDEKPIYGIGVPDGVPTRQRECKIFLGLTSNLVSSGMREIIKFVCKHKMVDVICVTAGGVEEDLIKCLGSTHLGDFHLPGAALRARGLSITFSEPNPQIVSAI